MGTSKVTVYLIDKTNYLLQIVVIVGYLPTLVADSEFWVCTISDGMNFNTSRQVRTDSS